MPDLSVRRRDAEDRAGRAGQGSPQARLLVAAALAACACCASAAAADGGPRRSVLLVGWDGATGARVERLLAEGALPNLGRVVSRGGFSRPRVTTGTTQTKPGWTEILTGCSAERLGVMNNRIYLPIPPGLTLFSRLKRRYSAAVFTAFLSGKKVNPGARGPHEICSNCRTRDQARREETPWFERGEFSGGTVDGRPPLWAKRAGEPFFSALPDIDLYRHGLGGADAVGARALEVLDRHARRGFFIFVHFQEPDEQGHLFGEASAQYREGMLTADRWLGRLLERLEKSGAAGRTDVFVMSDHGMDKGAYEHTKAADMFLAATDAALARAEDRKDAAGLMLAAFGEEPGVFAAACR